MKIKEIDNGKLNLGLYSSADWLSTFPKVKTLGIFNKNNELIGQFHYLKVNMKSQRAILTPLFATNVSLVLNDRSEKGSSSIAFNKEVMESIADHLKVSGAKIIDISFPGTFQDMQAFQWAGFEVKPKYTYQLNLKLSEEQLLNNMSSSTRSNLKKALKELKVYEANDVDGFLRLCDLTFNRQKEKYHRDELEKILRSSSLENNRSCYFVSENGKNIAAVLVVFDDKMAYYTIGGYDHSSKHRGGSTLAMWSAIQKMKNEGKHVFDFQGSMIPTVEQFVRGFGGEKKTYFNISRTKWYLKIAKRIF